MKLVEFSVREEMSKRTTRRRSVTRREFADCPFWVSLQNDINEIRVINSRNRILAYFDIDNQLWLGNVQWMTSVRRSITSGAPSDNIVSRSNIQESGFWSGLPPLKSEG